MSSPETTRPAASASPSRAPRQTWRSLEERAGPDALQGLVESKWPSQLADLTDPVRRREFLQLMGASIGLAGLAGCTRQPEEPILAYARHPESSLPGKPRFFATAFTLSGETQGVLVESHEGRPTKVEGNPDHPGSGGATCAFAQASVLGLYDPDRSQVVQKTGRILTWEEFASEAGPELDELRAKGGKGLAVLSETVVSPTLGAQARELLEQFPAARWHQYEPMNRDAERTAALASFGEDVTPEFRFEEAEVVLTLDADPLGHGIAATRNARGFGARRRAALAGDGHARWYAVEGSPSVTGSIADHRFPVRPSEVEDIARALLERLAPGTLAGDVKLEAPAWVAAVAADLSANAGRAAVVVGPHQPPVVHRIAHLLNERLGAYGSTIDLLPPAAELSVDQGESLAQLVEAMNAGEVRCLVILDGNPVFSTPASAGFAAALERVPLRVHHGLHDDETARMCQWHLPATHYLEHWSDARAADGTVALVQPLIAPLYNARSVHELVAFLGGAPLAPGAGYERVRATWRQRFGEAEFETRWRKALHDGVVEGSAREPRALQPDPAGLPERSAHGADGLELVFRPDPTIWDGRFANNGWLQELPKPVTLTTWDNAALLSPATAARLGVESRDIVQLELGEQTLEVAAWVVPGHPAEAVTLHLGYGRTRAGQVGTGAGVDVGTLRPVASSWAAGASLRPTGARHEIACVQDHHSMEGRDLVRLDTFEEARHAEEGGHAEDGHGDGHAAAAGGHGGGHVSLIENDDHAHDGHQWGMVIDLGSCTGCNACVVACQAENNVPVVGREEVARGREMHWLRVDRYFEGDPENPRAYHQPVPCMHCENAPCEVVCPVGATTHSAEGLNEMTYNRCVGTRYCSNNCPYKVRRFNFFQYADYETESLKMLHNPDVTVRFRGVMEKCTYCVQRINQARITGKKRGDGIQDGEVVTACQSVCPTQAITFGDLSDPDSVVSRKRADQRNYGLLEELNTKPRTTYLPALTDPNPELEA